MAYLLIGALMGALMRDYFYLCQLESSTFSLEITDALHLGATFRLPVYVFIDTWANITLGKTGDTLGEYGFYLRLNARDLQRIEKSYIARILLSPINDGKNEGLSENFSVGSGIIDEYFDGLIPFNSPPFPDSTATKYVNLCDNHDLPINCKIGELICWTDDLKKLADTHAEHDKTPQNPNSETSDNESEIKRLQRTVAALALGLADKYPVYRYGEKPNISKLVSLATDNLRSEQGDQVPNGFGKSTMENTIKAALESCPELKER